jgi:hypothetical protein
MKLGLLVALVIGTLGEISEYETMSCDKCTGYGYDECIRYCKDDIAVQSFDSKTEVETLSNVVELLSEIESPLESKDLIALPEAEETGIYIYGMLSALLFSIFITLAYMKSSSKPQKYRLDKFPESKTSYILL